MRAARFLFALAALGLASACSSSIEGTAIGTTTSAAASSTTTPAPPTPLALGSEATADGGVRITVFNVSSNAAPEAPAPASGGRWYAADVQLCAGRAEVTAGWRQWVVLDASGGRYEGASVSYRQFPVPTFPFVETPVPAGECVRGWVMFPVGEGTQIERVRFTDTRNVQAMTWSTDGAQGPEAVSEPSEATVPSPEPPPETIPTQTAPIATAAEPEPEPELIPPATGSSMVTVGQPCSTPSAIGIDVNTGAEIVCVYMGAGTGSRWVSSVPIVGVNEVGAPCDSNDGASRTPEGLAIMCVQGEWVYGP
jgi:hypothetical protein